ncbi:MAG: exo-alpha-sialidase [Terriglobales bacterium]
MAKTKEVHLYVGTKKGGFLLRSDLKRKKWKVDGPFFAGSEVTNLSRDPRTGDIWAASVNGWFGPDLQVSRNRGKTWTKSNQGIEFAKDRGLNLARIWRVEPDRASRPGTLWCGADPGALFRSDNGGKEWYEVAGLTQHPTRDQWNAGGGGMMVHAIACDPQRPQRIYAGISAAGCFRSDDDGKSWAPMNQGVLADFNPEPDKYPFVGQCLHSMVMNPRDPNVLYQQNHCGAYASQDGGATWQDINKGLPSRFGFPIALDPHAKETIFVIPETGAEARYVPNGKMIIYRSKNGGKKWQKLTKGLPQEHAYLQVLRHGMTTDQAEKTGVYFGTTSGMIYFSRNGGDSWEVLQSNLAAILSLHAAVV